MALGRLSAASLDPAARLCLCHARFDQAAPPLPAAHGPSTKSFIIRDANGQALAYVYYGIRPGGGWRCTGARLLGKE